MGRVGLFTVTTPRVRQYHSVTPTAVNGMSQLPLGGAETVPRGNRSQNLRTMDGTVHAFTIVLLPPLPARRVDLFTDVTTAL